jgi:hypothetical protein
MSFRSPQGREPALSEVEGNLLFARSAATLEASGSPYHLCGADTLVRATAEI